jgi:hypothetical protein
MRSIFLLAGLFLAALADRRRNAYFRSAAPWLSAALLALAVAPHVIWLVGEGFQPFIHAAVRRGAISFAAWMRSLGETAGGTFVYASPALLLGLALARPSLAATGAAPRTQFRQPASPLAPGSIGAGTALRAMGLIG